ncbi:hypothetical protein HN604_03300 [archaeon]|jgi:hypothetical protein|nr:hypothetical protein [archaeon]MBT6182687.1 hypothetical protein [archaeon]MBT6606203.1 hypothetical protein [archaeon]MBT7251628.1 hypothetical protein [archaeon]MBT7661082.1 hypothetical protein [archaeon]
MKEKVVIWSIVISMIVFISLIGIYFNLIPISYNPGDNFDVTLTINGPGDGDDGGSDGSGGGGGGGGGGAEGGSGNGICSELWECSFWMECVNVKDEFPLGFLSEENYAVAKELCSFEDYNEEICGYQIRTCEDSQSCNNEILINEMPSLFQACYFVENPSCTDGIVNCHDDSCELGIDCGGPCESCELEKPSSNSLSWFSKILIFFGFKSPITSNELIIGGIIVSGLMMIALIIYWILIFFDFAFSFGNRNAFKK